MFSLKSYWNPYEIDWIDGKWWKSIGIPKKTAESQSEMIQ
jgi:hypothetical protein